MVELANMSGRGQLTIPYRLRKTFNLDEGSQVLLTKIGNTIVIFPLNKPMVNVSDLYSSVSPKRKSTNPDVALSQAKKLKAKTVV